MKNYIAEIKNDKFTFTELNEISKEILCNYSVFCIDPINNTYIYYPIGLGINDLDDLAYQFLSR